MGNTQLDYQAMWGELIAVSRAREFAAEDRIEALRKAAEWCYTGAPGGQRKQLFSPHGPCAVGYALLQLDDDRHNWTAAAMGMSIATQVFTGDDFSDPRVSRASALIAEAAHDFDSYQLPGCARKLERAADLLELALTRPEARELPEEEAAAFNFSVVHGFEPGFVNLYDMPDEEGFEVACDLVLSQERTHAVLTPV